MAQIGSPPAGWYTDPTGQHRARYWDGWRWTEQVRDDVGDPAQVSGGVGAGHAAASTVAGVAEAVAAVATSDVAPGAAPTGTPAPVVEDRTDAARAPVSPSAGPPAGWYPDPSSRHQARFWDGSAWTARVADQGIEGMDPLSGGPATSTGTVDPTVGAWSAELVGAMEAAGPGSLDGKPLSAGQISLASLPETSESEGSEVRHQARPSVKVRAAGGVVLGGAIALLVGSTMAWMRVTGPRVGDEWTSSGLDLGDGRITVALALVLAVLGAGIITGRMARFGGTKVAAMGALVAGAAALAVTAVDIADVADRAPRLGVPAGAVSNVGTGLWLAFLGALFAVVGGLMAFANRR
jgi:hypothetical protein